MKSGFAARLSRSASGIMPTQQEYCIVTVEALLDACPKMYEEQAMQIINDAVYEYYITQRGDTNIEEMIHIIRKVNFSTKRLKRHMKASLAEMEKEQEAEKLAAQR